MTCECGYADECDGEHATHHPLQDGGMCAVDKCRAQRRAVPEPRADFTDDELGREHLRQNPAMEMGLWQNWVLVVCKRMNIAPPTGREWDALMRNWRHGKAPLASVDELSALRKPPNDQVKGPAEGRSL